MFRTLHGWRERNRTEFYRLLQRHGLTPESSAATGPMSNNEQEPL